MIRQWEGGAAYEVAAASSEMAAERHDPETGSRQQAESVSPRHLKKRNTEETLN